MCLQIISERNENQTSRNSARKTFCLKTATIYIEIPVMISMIAKLYSSTVMRKGQLASCL